MSLDSAIARASAAANWLTRTLPDDPDDLESPFGRTAITWNYAWLEFGPPVVPDAEPGDIVYARASSGTFVSARMSEAGETASRMSGASQSYSR